MNLRLKLISILAGILVTSAAALLPAAGEGLAAIGQAMRQYSGSSVGGTEVTGPVGDPRGRGPGPAAEAGGVVEPWHLWARNPADAPLLIEATVLATGGTDVSMVIAGVTNVIGGVGSCDTESATNRIYPGLRPYETYQLSMSGPSWSGAKLVFKGYTPRHLLAKRGVRSLALPYRVYINGELVPESTNLVFSFSCGNRTTNLSVELRPERGLRPVLAGAYEENWSRDESQDGAAPGDGQWPEIGPGRSTNLASGAFRWSVSMGSLLTELSAGRIRLNEQLIASNLFTADALSYTARSTNLADVRVITSGGVLRQIRAPQALADIQSTYSPTQECVLKFFIPAHVSATTNGSGLYTVLTNTPFVTWRIRNPESPGTYRRFQVIEERPASRTYASEVSYDSTNKVWRLVYGSGTEQRTEQRTVSLSGGTRQEIVEIKSPTNTVYKAVERYAKYAWGWELTNVVTNPDGQGLTNSFSFYNDPAEPASFGKLKDRFYPGGRWERHCYPYADESGDPQCAGWNYGSIGDFPELDDAGGTVRVYPWKDSPATPDAAISDLVAITKQSPYFNGIHANITSQTFQHALNASNQTAVLSGSGVADGDHVQPESGYTASDWRWDGLYIGAHNNFLVNFRYRLTGSWLHDLVRLQSRKDKWATLIQYDRGLYNGSWTADPTNGQHIVTVKTTGSYGMLDPGEYPWTVYRDFGWDSLQLGIYCILGKSTREVALLVGGRTTLLDTYGLTSVSGGAGGDEAVFGNLVERRLMQHDSLGHLTNVTWIDGKNTNVTRTVYRASWRDPSGNDSELKAWEMDEQGRQVLFAYDSLKRLTNSTLVGVAAAGGFPAQSDIATNLVFNAAGWMVKQTVSGGGLALAQSVKHDLSGRVVESSDPAGVLVTTSYSADGRTTTETFPGGFQKITSRYLDGRLKSVTGTAVVPEHFDYWADFAADAVFEGSAFERTYIGSPGSPRWKERQRSSVGHVVYERMPAFSTTNGAPPIEIHYDHFYPPWFCLYEDMPTVVSVPATVVEGEVHHLVKKLHTDLCGLLAPYQSSFGQSVYGPNTQTKLEGADSTVEHDGTNWWRVTREWWWTSDGVGRTNVTRARLSGFTSATTLEDVSITDPDGNVTTVTVTLDLAARKLTAVTNTPTSTINITGVVINGLLQSLNSESVSQPAWFYYDSLRRPVAARDPLGFSTGTRYDPANGWVLAVTNAAGKVTQFEYYAANLAHAGKLKCRTDPNGRKTYYDYNGRGQQTRLWGDVPYPEERIYDATYGDLKELRTFRGGSNWSSPTWPGGSESYDTTTWNYDAATGLVVSKVDAAGRGYTNVYHSTRTLWTRQLARGVVITNQFNAFGEILRKDYSDGTPSFVVEWYTSLGQPTKVTDAFGTVNYAYDEDGALLARTFDWDSPFAGLAITNRIDPLYGRDRLVVDSQIAGNTFQFLTGYQYDPATGRPLAVQSSFTNAAAGSPVTNSVTYAYLANSDLVRTATAKAGAATVMTTTRGWDHGYRLRSVHSVLGAAGAAVNSYTYDYDDVDRRTRATLADASAWAYEYDDRHEVTGAARFWADQTLVAGQQFEFAYDAVGNRKTMKRGGDEAGAGRLATAYTVNNLNQYTGIAHPGAVDVLGVATASAVVSVNGQAAYERGEYWWKSVPVPNGSGPQWAAITNTAVGGGTSNVVGRVYVPPAAEILIYDADGNLTQDGRWTYAWDAENRLVRLETAPAAVSNGVPRLRLDFGYDWQNRRLSKTVLTNWNGTAYTVTNGSRFLYDGWNLVAELNATNAPVRSYVWGLDLGGGLEDEGNVGGMVELLDHSTGPPTRWFAAYDGNANLTALVRGDQTVGARYEYGPFGELLRATGPVAAANPVRWSSRYWDAEADLVYYGWRYYSPAQGRWLGRDPIEEADTVNLYAYVRNLPLSYVDPDGRAIFDFMRGIHGKSKTLYAIFRLAGLLSGENKLPPDIFTRLEREKRKIERVVKQAKKDNIGQGGGRDDPPGSVKRRAVSVVAGLGFVAIDAFVRASDAVLAHVIGGQSVSPHAQSMFANLDRGEQAFADLDAINAALDLSGGAGYAATIAAGVFFAAGEEYVSGREP